MQRLFAAAVACAAFSFSAFAGAGSSTHAALASAYASTATGSVSRLVNDYEMASRIIVAQANETAAVGVVAEALSGAGEVRAECTAECCEAEKTAELSPADQAASDALAALKSAAAEEETRKTAQIEAAIASFEAHREEVVVAAAAPEPVVEVAVEPVVEAVVEAVVEPAVEIVLVENDTPAVEAAAVESPGEAPAIAPDQVAALVDAMAQQMKVAVVSAQRANEEAQQVVQAREEAQALLHLISELKNEAERMSAEIRDLREQLNAERVDAQAASHDETGASQLEAALASLSVPTSQNAVQTASTVLGS